MICILKGDNLEERIKLKPIVGWRLFLLAEEKNLGLSHVGFNKRTVRYRTR